MNGHIANHTIQNIWIFQTLWGGVKTNTIHIIDKNTVDKYLKLTCHHINRRHICFNIKSISVDPLFWMDVMLDFFCMVFAELLSSGYKRKLQNDNV